MIPGKSKASTTIASVAVLILVYAIGILNFQTTIIASVESQNRFPTLTTVDPDATSCTELLQKFRADEIEAAKTRGDKNYKRAYTTITNTNKPFYVSTHDEKIDKVRSDIVHRQFYYERQLTNRVAEIFEEKRMQGDESIMLDVGANIGWFSLVAAAHGATKVYAFEPYVVNTIRLCESLTMNRWLHDDSSQDIVVPISKGASNYTGKLQFFQVDPRNPGSFSFRENFIENAIGELEVVTLDKFADQHGWFVSKPSIGLFKLDVESYELEVIKGAEKLLRSHLIEKIAMELRQLIRPEVKLEIVSRLFEAGYELYMHGNFMGPHNNVTKVYDIPETLVADLEKKEYGENVMFRLRK